MTDAEFDWLTLDAGEEVIWSGTPHLLGHVWVFVAGALLVPLFGVGLAMIAWAYLRLTNTAYVISTESVYKKTGVLSRTVTEIGHEKIQDTSYSQTVVGRYVGFGTVEISTAGGSGVEMRLAYVPAPLDVQSRLDEIAVTPSATRRDEQAQSDGVRLDGETLAELVDEMRATREAMESIERRLDDEQ